MAVLYSNNASSTLSASITSTATSLSVASGKGALFPAPTGGDYFYVTLVNTAGAIEIMKVTARSTDTLTVVRGQDGTTGVAWAAGDRVELRFTKGMLDDIKSERMPASGPSVGSNGRILVNLSGNPAWSDATFTYDLATAQFRAGNFRANVGDTAPTWNFNNILHAGNYTSYSPSLTGSGASGTWGISITGYAYGLNTLDTDRTIANRLPNSTPQSVRFDFANANAVGTGGNYAGVMTFSPWVGTTGSTGDASYQLVFGSTATNGSGTPRLRIRNGIDSTWNAWYDLYTGANYAAQNAWTPIVSGGVTRISQTTWAKTGGNAASWDGQLYSAEAYPTNVYCQASFGNSSSDVMFGLSVLDGSTDTSANYTVIDYAWNAAANGNVYIYENGTQAGIVAGYGTYTASTVFTITYDGANVRYYKDGVVQRTVARTVGNGLYFDSSFYTGNYGAQLYNIQFGRLSQHLLTKSGGTMSGPLVINADDGLKATYGGTDGDTWYRGWGMESNRGSVYIRPTTNNSANLRIGYSEGSQNWGTVRVDAANFTQNGNQVLHAGNYTSYAASASHTHTLLTAVGSYLWDASTTPASYSQGIQSSFVSSSQGFQNYGSVLTMNTYSGGGGALQLYVPYSPTYGGSSLQIRQGNYDVNSGNSWTSWKTLLDSSNYTSYGDGRYVLKSGDTMTGALTINSSLNVQRYNEASYSKWSYSWGGNQDLAWKRVATLKSNVTDGWRGTSGKVAVYHEGSNHGAGLRTEYTAYFYTQYSSGGTALDNAYIYLSPGASNLIRLFKVGTRHYEVQVRQPGDWVLMGAILEIDENSGDATVYETSIQAGTTVGSVVTAGTYNENINITGNASGYAKQLGGFSGDVDYDLFSFVANGPAIRARWSGGTANRYIDFGWVDNSNVFTSGFKITNGNTPTWVGNDILHAGNYTSYALPITGGTVTGYLGATNQLALSGAATSAGDFHTSATTGATTIGGASQSGTQTFGRSTVSHIVNIATGATSSANTKTVNIGTGGLSGAFTYLYLGSSSGTSYVNTYGTFTSYGTARVSKLSDHSYLQLNRSTTSYEAGLNFQTNGTTYWWNYTPSSSTADLNWYANGAIRMQLTNSGILYVNSNTVLHSANYSSYALPLTGGTVSGNIIPLVDQGYTFGASNRRWGNVYTNAVTFLDGTQQTTAAGAPSANTAIGAVVIAWANTATAMVQGQTIAGSSLYIANTSATLGANYLQFNATTPGLAGSFYTTVSNILTANTTVLTSGNVGYQNPPTATGITVLSGTWRLVSPAVPARSYSYDGYGNLTYSNMRQGIWVRVS